MDIGSILLLVALLIPVSLYISQPIFARKNVVGDTTKDKIDHDLSTLLAEKERILEALEELDFDYQLGKIPGADYPDQRSDMLKRGADILRLLDDLQTQTSTGSKVESIEAIIAASRSRASQIQAISTGNEAEEDQLAQKEHENKGIDLVAADDDLEILIATRRRDRHSKSGGFCPQCGQPLHKSDRFCPKCGTSMV